MAFRKCRDCGQLVSINASSCPSCGNAAVNADFTTFANIVSLSKKTQSMLMKPAIGFALFGAVVIAAGGATGIIAGIIFELVAAGLIALGILKVKNAKKKQKEHYDRVVVQ